MIYCIGHRERYDAGLAKGPFYKLGRGLRNGTFEPGGSVWQTEAEARTFIARTGIGATREVYGVEADWDSDTLQLRDEPFRRLVKTAAVIRLPRQGDPHA